MKNINHMRAELEQYSGSDVFYRHWSAKNMFYTEGVHELLEEAEAYWLLNMIALDLLPRAFKKAPDWFYCVYLTVKANCNAFVRLTDGHDDAKNIVSRRVEYTDFPIVKQLKLFLCKTTVESQNGYCLMLPSEY